MTDELSSRSGFHCSHWSSSLFLFTAHFCPLPFSFIFNPSLVAPAAVGSSKEARCLILPLSVLQERTGLFPPRSSKTTKITKI